MNISVSPSLLSGTAKAPPGKSMAVRMAAAAVCAKGTCVFRNYPQSDDAQIALDLARTLGASVTINGNDVHITSSGKLRAGELNCGESGLASRLFPFLAATVEGSSNVTGSGSLRSRTIQPLLDGLAAVGVNAMAENARLPVHFTGPMKSGAITIDGSLSSQVITGLLMALPLADGDSEIAVTNTVSRPYLQMTIDVLKQFGVEIRHEDFRHFYIPGRQLYRPLEAEVPGDWSGASFLLMAGALGAEGEITVKGLSLFPTQADNHILNAMQAAGIVFNTKDDTYAVRNSHGEIKPFDFDATDCPDLVPPLVALASFANGISTITGTKRLRHKESNRAKVLAEEFAKANVRILLRDDEMKIYPGAIRPCTINAHNDHRIAMAASLLGIAGARVTITGAECVAKSYPDYWETLQGLGARIV